MGFNRGVFAGRRVRVGVVLVALSACVAAGWGSAASSDAASLKGKPFVWLSDTDTTGKGSIYGTQIYAVQQAVTAYVNKHGGINGRKVVLVHVSDNSDATTAVSNITSYISAHGNPDLIWPGQESTIIAAVMPVAARAHVMTFAGNDGGGLLKAGASSNYPLAFAAQADTRPPTQAMAKFFKSKGVTSVGILEESYAYMQGETPDAVRALDAVGIKHTVAQFTPDQTDLTSQMGSLKNAGVQGIFFEGLGVASGYALKARNQLGWSAPIVGDLAASSLDLTTLVDTALLKNVKIVVFRPNNGSAKLPGVAMIKKWSKPYASTAVIDKVPISTPGAAWDALLLVQHAARQAGSTKPASIARALQKLGKKARSDKLYVLYGTYGYSANTHDVLTAGAADYPVINPGPVQGGQVQPLNG
jgi:ABC-type branched-subunit amino acid transport system substrate-binding protein